MSKYETVSGSYSDPAPGQDFDEVSQAAAILLAVAGVTCTQCGETVPVPSHATPTKALALHQDGFCGKQPAPPPVVEAPSLFDAVLSEEGKVEGQAQVQEHATEAGYTETFMRAVRELAATGKEFTSEEVRQLAGEPGQFGVHASSVGALMTAAGRLGMIRQTGQYRPATGTRSKRAILSMWVGSSLSVGVDEHKNLV